MAYLWGYTYLMTNFIPGNKFSLPRNRRKNVSFPNLKRQDILKVLEYFLKIRLDIHLGPKIKPTQISEKIKLKK